MSGGMRVVFNGVRGSTPCAGPEYARFGGHSSCVALETDDGPTIGFRVDFHGLSVAYIPDHGPGCCPDDADDFIPHEILELCDGVDVLIHDAQHTPAEYEPKRHWGHCTVDYAVHVAREAGAR